MRTFVLKHFKISYLAVVNTAKKLYNLGARSGRWNILLFTIYSVWLHFRDQFWADADKLEKNYSIKHLLTFSIFYWVIYALLNKTVLSVKKFVSWMQWYRQQKQKKNISIERVSHLPKFFQMRYQNKYFHRLRRKYIHLNTLNIQMPYCLTIFVQNLNNSIWLHGDVSKTFCMSGKQCRPCKDICSKSCLHNLRWPVSLNTKVNIVYTTLQIRSSTRKYVFISPWKHMLWVLIRSAQWGTSHEYPQYIF